jgi:hypothetical protein
MENNESMNPRNILVFSIAIGDYKTRFNDCINTHYEYCRKNNFQYLLVDRSPRALKPFEAAWLKIALIIAALKKGFDWVIFLDSDCEIRQHAPDIEKYIQTLPGSESKSVFVAPGYSGRINSGVIILKNTTDSLELFQIILCSAAKEVPRPDKAPFENGHVIHYMKSSNIVYMLDHCCWNNNSELNLKSYIQHYSAGCLREWYLKNKHLSANNKGNIYTKFNLFLCSLKISNINSTLKDLMPYYCNEYEVYFKI